MILDQDIPIKIGDGELFFVNPGHKLFIELTGMTRSEEESKAREEMPQEAKFKELWEQLNDVKNISYKDGSPVTKESLLAGKHTLEFFTVARNLYIQALVKLAQGELVSSKNE